jgi:alanine racemase
MGFAPQAVIDYSALGHNLRQVYERSPQCRVWAVIKANAYGHGIEGVSQALAGVDGFAVARIEEALRLRQLGIVKPLLVLGGVFSSADLEQALTANCQLVVHQQQQLQLLQAYRGEGRLSVWLKVDTGMHRLGVPPSSTRQMLERLRACRVVDEINLMTHLANADDRSDETTLRQCEVFASLPLAEFNRLSVANSAGLMAWRDSRRGWVRPGIMLYGVSPFLDSVGPDEGLRPVMTFKARVIAVNRHQKGAPVGYGGAYRCPEAMPIAVVGVGYGDGYPRHAGNGTPVLVRSRRLPLVGRVSMDTLCVDARALPGLEVGEEAVLWGEGLPVEEIARATGTIPYELLCGITGRVEFVGRAEGEGEQRGTG